MAIPPVIVFPVVQALAFVVAVVVLTSAGQSQDTQPRLRGQLYPNWRRLGLDDAQVQKIYKIQADYKAKTENLEKQLASLKAEQKTAVDAVLTPAQKTKLREILLGKAPSDK